MKMNLILLSFLSGLLVFAYFWEEKSGKTSISTQLFEKSPESLLLKNLALEKMIDGWQLKKYQVLINSNYSKLINKMLSGLSVISEIKVESNKLHEYFSLTNLSFQVNQENFILGDYSQIDKGFYIQKENSLFLVKDTNEYEGVFRSAEEEDFKKYVNLKNFIDSKVSHLFPTQIISNLTNLDSLLFFNRGEKFELLIKSNSTIPAPKSTIQVSNLSEQLNTLNHFSSLLNVFEQKNKPEEAISIRVVVNEQSESFELILYNKFRKKEGLFIWSSRLSVVLEIDSVDKTLFSTTVSDYWLKQFSLLKRIRSKKSINFSLVKNKKEVNGSVLDTSKFSYSSDEYDLDKNKFNLLFGVLLNNAPFEQSSFVTDQSTRKYDFDFIVDQQRYSFKSLDGILNVYEHSTGVEFVFVKQKASLPKLIFEDLFTLNEKRP